MDELSTVLSLVVELWFQFTVIILPGPPVLGFQPLPVLQLSNTAHSMLYILLQFHNQLSIKFLEETSLRNLLLTHYANSPR